MSEALGGMEAQIRPPVGIWGLGIWVPSTVVSAAQLEAETGIPAQILEEKMGIRQVHRAGAACHVSDMAIAAAQAALADAGIGAADVDLLIYCGSEFKDYIVWSAAATIAHALGCERAQVFEIYALCAGTPISLQVVRDMLLAEPELRTALVVAASRESALVNLRNPRARFMFNFGDGASAAVVQRGLRRNRVLGTASLTDGSLSRDVIMPAGGSVRPASAETVAAGLHALDVPGLEHMKERLDAVSLANFRRVVAEALRKSGCQASTFLAPVHMKRSMYERLKEELGVERGFYLEDYGHMQAADQFVILERARAQHLLREGDTVVLAAAGVGYTWSAAIVSWGEQEGA
jgi:3-oxoacyl-[acyl-carrier-protein] synthase-3